MLKSLVLVFCIGSSIALASTSKFPIIKGENGKRYHTGLLHKPQAYKGLGETHVKLADCENLPEEFDLRKLGTVTAIKDQGSCGSCWSFSKTASLESAILANGGKSMDLSEKELLTCDRNNYGCDGGLLNQKEYQVVHGQGLESDFPYSPSDGPCKSIPVAVKATEFVMVGSSNRSPNLKEVKCALYKSHTVPWITVAAEGNWGQAPSTEDTMFRSCGRGQTNHAIGIVGWKKINGKEGLIIRNSWGMGWGAKGYAVMPLGCDNLGEEVAYIMTDAMPCKPPVFQLPAHIEISPNVEVMLGVKEQSGVEYTWYSADKEIGKGSMIYVIPSEDTIYKLVGKTACGTVESSVKISVIKASQAL